MRIGTCQILAVVALIVLSGCSNGRGSVGEAAGGQQPPPTTPTPTTPTPTPEPPTTQPPPTTPEPPATPPPSPPPEPEPPNPPEPEPEPPAEDVAAFAGYWSGRIADERSGRERRGVAFIDQLGEAHIMSLTEEEQPEFVLHGNLCCDSRAEKRLDANRYLNTRDEESEIEARLVDGRLEGRFEFRNREYEFSLSSLGAYSQPLSLSSLAGVYTRTITSGLLTETLTLTIDGNGAITGSHSNGCVISGNASIPDRSRNMARLDVQLTNCGSLSSSSRWNGDYDGLGILLKNAVSPSDPTKREDVFHYSIVGPTWLGPFSVAR